MNSRYQRMILARRYARSVTIRGPSTTPGMVRIHQLEPGADGNWQHKGSVELRQVEADSIYPDSIPWEESRRRGIGHGKPVAPTALPALKTPSMVPKPQPKKPVPLPGASNLKVNKPGGM